MATAFLASVPFAVVARPVDIWLRRNTRVLADYARAVLAFLGSDRNRTRFTPADFEAVAQAIGTNTSELFPGNTTPGPVDREGPSIELVEVFVAGGTAPLSGGARSVG